MDGILGLKFWHFKSGYRVRLLFSLATCHQRCQYGERRLRFSLKIKLKSPIYLGSGVEANFVSGDFNSRIAAFDDYLQRSGWGSTQSLFGWFCKHGESMTCFLKESMYCQYKDILKLIKHLYPWRVKQWLTIHFFTIWLLTNLWLIWSIGFKSIKFANCMNLIGERCRIPLLWNP